MFEVQDDGLQFDLDKRLPVLCRCATDFSRAWLAARK